MSAVILKYNAITEQYLYEFASAARGVISVSTEILVVADIAERNAIPNPENRIVKVLDASADPTVNAGYAYYVYLRGTGWDKLSEEESMDLDGMTNHTHPNLEILNSYTSSNTDVVSAINLKHTHSNKATIDLFSYSGGILSFDGQTIMTTAVSFEPVYIPFTINAVDDGEDNVYSFSLSELGIAKGTDVSVWSQDGSSISKLECDVSYDATSLYIDLTGFPISTYLLYFMRRAGSGSSSGLHSIQFEITADMTLKTFTLLDLGVSNKVDVNVWYLDPANNKEVKTSMSIAWSSADILLLNTTGFTPGTYFVRYTYL